MVISIDMSVPIVVFWPLMVNFMDVLDLMVTVELFGKTLLNSNTLFPSPSVASESNFIVALAGSKGFFTS